MDRIKNTIKAITFKNPENIPLELVEVPGIFDDYQTVDREKVDKTFEGLHVLMLFRQLTAGPLRIKQ